MPAAPVTVVLVEEQTLLRQFLVDLVNGIGGYTVIGHTDNRVVALELCERHQPRLAIVELLLAEPAPLSIAADLKARSPGTHVLVLSSRLDREWVQEAVSAGAAGFIDKFSDLAALRRAIDVVAQGGEYFSPKVSSVLTELLRLRSQPAEGPLLSYRECQVLREIARGRISKEMAESLGLSVFTIENLRRRIMRKTGLHSVAELTLHAMKLGLIASPGSEQAVGDGSRAPLPARPGATQV